MSRMSREELERHLSVLRTEEILRFLRDDTLLEIADRYFTSFGMGSNQNENPTSLETPASAFVAQSGEPSTERAKRPLNAFMAFRSYYFRLFPELQQKIASGFLTTLWNKDSYRNEWALIAKVYSFVRDQLGRDKVPLSQFLDISCPIMKIIEPSLYLSAFGWSVEDEAGTPKLFQANSSTNVIPPPLQSDDHPNTENDLLSAIISVGYLPDDSVNLMERMSASSNGILTTASESLPVSLATASESLPVSLTTASESLPVSLTTASESLPVSLTKEKAKFMEVVERDPFQAARDLLGPHYEERNVSVSMNLA
ncbi:mating-type protein MAT alpha 1 domain-containing protein [Trichoderma ceciliae]